jgi:alpha-glucosidase
MASDLVSNYEDQPAFEFFEMLPADFDESKVLLAEIGDVYSVARRKGDSWYIGTITDENERIVELDLSFLENGKMYIAKIFADGKHANLKNNPTDIEIIELEVHSKTKLSVKMIESGGQAVAIVPLRD